MSRISHHHMVCDNKEMGIATRTKQHNRDALNNIQLGLGQKFGDLWI